MKILAGLLGVSLASDCCEYIQINGNGMLHPMTAIWKRSSRRSMTNKAIYYKVNSDGEQDHSGDYRWITNKNMDGQWGYQQAQSGDFWIMDQSEHGGFYGRSVQIKDDQQECFEDVLNALGNTATCALDSQMGNCWGSSIQVESECVIINGSEDENESIIQDTAEDTVEDTTVTDLMKLKRLSKIAYK